MCRLKKVINSTEDEDKDDIVVAWNCRRGAASCDIKNLRLAERSKILIREAMANNSVATPTNPISTLVKMVDNKLLIEESESPILARVISAYGSGYGLMLEAEPYVDIGDARWDMFSKDTNHEGDLKLVSGVTAADMIRRYGMSSGMAANAYAVLHEAWYIARGDGDCVIEYDGGAYELVWVQYDGRGADIRVTEDTLADEKKIVDLMYYCKMISMPKFGVRDQRWFYISDDNLGDLSWRNYDALYDYYGLTCGMLHAFSKGVSDDASLELCVVARIVSDVCDIQRDINEHELANFILVSRRRSHAIACVMGVIIRLIDNMTYNVRAMLIAIVLYEMLFERTGFVRFRSVEATTAANVNPVFTDSIRASFEEALAGPENIVNQNHYGETMCAHGNVWRDHCGGNLCMEVTNVVDTVNNVSIMSHTLYGFRRGDEFKCAISRLLCGSKRSVISFGVWQILQ